MNQQTKCIYKEQNILLSMGSVAYNLLNTFLFKFNFVLTYSPFLTNSLISMINSLRSNKDLLLTVNESVQIYECVQAAGRIKGDIAEVGVYKGGSAKIIASFKGDKSLYLFDTFEGLPDISKKDQHFKKGLFVAPLDSVKELLKGYKKVYFYKGVFPESSAPVRNKQFAFVHLDVDLYQSTKDSLEFFYPRMSSGGMILSHDYPSAVGVKKAFDEFIKNKPETVIKLSGNQCLLVKI